MRTAHILTSRGYFTGSKSKSLVANGLYELILNPKCNSLIHIFTSHHYTMFKFGFKLQPSYTYILCTKRQLPIQQSGQSPLFCCGRIVCSFTSSRLNVGKRIYSCFPLWTGDGERAPVGLTCFPWSPHDGAVCSALASCCASYLLHRAWYLQDRVLQFKHMGFKLSSSIAPREDVEEDRIAPSSGDSLCSSYCVRVNKTLTRVSLLFGKLFHWLL